MSYKDIKKCKEHHGLDSLSWDDWQIMLINDGVNHDYVCDVDYYDYGYVYCEECERLIQVE